MSLHWDCNKPPPPIGVGFLGHLILSGRLRGQYAPPPLTGLQGPVRTAERGPLVGLLGPHEAEKVFANGDFIKSKKMEKKESHRVSLIADEGTGANGPGLFL